VRGSNSEGGTFSPLQERVRGASHMDRSVLYLRGGKRGLKQVCSKLLRITNGRKKKIKVKYWKADVLP